MCYWIAVRVPGQREQAIAGRLQKEISALVYLPLMRIRSPHTGKPIIKPLYATYVFCDLDASPHWAVIKRHQGVLTVVMAGDQPGKCPESEILKLKAAEVCGVVQLAGPPPTPETRPKVGSLVKIAFGPLAGEQGVYASHKGAHKAKVTVFLLGREVEVELAAGALAAIAA